MKIIKITTPIVLATVLFLHTSCNKSFFTDVNNNPNAPSNVVPSTLLSTVEGSLAFTQGGDMSRFTSMFTQQTLGASRQAGAYYQYIITSQDIDGLWANMYTSVMENDNTLMQAADAKGYNVYSGISRVLMAYSMQLMVDCWGKVPYSQAFQGIKNLQPAYDNDATLYTNILSLCDDAISYLGKSNPGILTPGSEDVLYAGDAGQWTKFAHAIKARIYLHQSKSNSTMANKALAEIALSFTGNADNAYYTFGSTETTANPWYQFNEQRGDISFIGSNMLDSMLSWNDPRYTKLVDTSGGGDALTAYYGGNGATTGINGVVEFIMYDELQFMKAEATINSGGTVTNAQTAYQAGITANMQRLGVGATAITAYITTNGTLSSASAAAISKIAYQEYVALYLNPEAWTLWRRTASPTLIKINGNDVPRRFLYPQTEYSYNAGNVPSSTLYAPKVFWDN